MRKAKFLMERLADLKEECTLEHDMAPGSALGANSSRGPLAATCLRPNSYKYIYAIELPTQLTGSSVTLSEMKHLSLKINELLHYLQPPSG